MERKFKTRIWNYYASYKRRMPWRDNTDPYWVLVSEIMLQQTQVDRVIPKFNAFVERFPGLESLAISKLSEVLTAWSGLGYNRRAKFLHESAKKIVSEHGGKLPQSQQELISLPGVGPNTAGAICAYAYNQPVIFIETNIRAVYIHEFFDGRRDVADAEILKLVEETLDSQNPREWYWALMDYGAYLKKIHPNPSRASKHHTKQSKFEGSVRQARGAVIRLLAIKTQSKDELVEEIDSTLLDKALHSLVQDGLIEYQNNRYRLKA